MKIKVIDLINRCLCRDDTLPQKIIYKGKEFTFNTNSHFPYFYDTDKGVNFMSVIEYFQDLEEEVEIVEVLEEDKEIEELDYCEENTFSNMKEITCLTSEERRLLDSNFKSIKEKFDEIVRKLNELKKGK